jgi:hypothetical protein
MRATMSKTGLLLECQRWAREDVAWTERTDTFASAAGTGTHSRTEGMVDGAVSLADCANDTERALHAYVSDRRRAFGMSLLSEVPFAWDPAFDTARQLEKGAPREYRGARPTEFCGTVDMVALDGNSAIVWDLFTGRDWSHKIQQQRALAVAVARAWNVSTVTWVIVHAADGQVTEVQSETMGAFELAAMAAMMLDALLGIANAGPIPGSHCTEQWCPHIAACPATQSAVAELVPTDALVRHTMTADITTVEHAAWVLPRLKLLRSFCDAADKSLKALVRSAGPVPLPNGREWRECSRTMPRFDKNKAVALLAQLGATAAQIDSLTTQRDEAYFDERKV